MTQPASSDLQAALPPNNSLRMGTATDSGDGTATISVQGSNVNCGFLDPSKFFTGDPVALLRGESSWLALGSVRTSLPRVVFASIWSDGASTNAATGTFTKMDLGTVIEDQGAPASMADTTNSRLVCQVAGLYRMSGQIQWPANATGVSGIFLKLNNTTYLASVSTPNTASDQGRRQITRTYRLAAGDYIELWGWQNTGGTIAAGGVTTYGANWLEWEFIGR